MKDEADQKRYLHVLATGQEHGDVEIVSLGIKVVLEFVKL